VPCLWDGATTKVFTPETILWLKAAARPALSKENTVSVPLTQPSNRPFDALWVIAHAVLGATESQGVK
jgi:hypothetical protein